MWRLSLIAFRDNECMYGQKARAIKIAFPCAHLSKVIYAQIRFTSTISGLLMMHVDCG